MSEHQKKYEKNILIYFSNEINLLFVFKLFFLYIAKTFKAALIYKLKKPLSVK